MPEKPSTNQRMAALITGASTGIGYELAKLFAEDGYDVVMVARGRERLEMVASELRGHYGVTVHVLPKDLSRPEAPTELFEAVGDVGVTVDALVNNAGYGRLGPFAKDKTANQVGMVHVNVVSLVHLTHLFLPGMLERGHGRILNVSSIAAYQPGPMMAVYYATKAFVTSFSEALSNELKGSGVTVTTLSPGPTRTGFQARANTAESRLNAGPMVMDAEPVARAGYESMKRGRRNVIPGWTNRFLAFASVKLFPKSVVLWVVRFFHKR